MRTYEEELIHESEMTHDTAIRCNYKRPDLAKYLVRLGGKHWRCKDMSRIYLTHLEVLKILGGEDLVRNLYDLSSHRFTWATHLISGYFDCVLDEYVLGKKLNERDLSENPRVLEILELLEKNFNKNLLDNL